MTLPEPIPPPIETPHLASAETPAATPRGFERRVLGLAAPVIGENLLQTMLGVLDFGRDAADGMKSSITWGWE